MANTIYYWNKFTFMLILFLFVLKILYSRKNEIPIEI